MKKLYICFFIMISFFINIDNIFAGVKASDYKIGKFVYYDPVKNATCSANNYWTIYNQHTTCYRWAIIDNYDVAGVIRIMIDHDIGVSNFSERNKVIQNAISSWNIPKLSEAKKDTLSLNSDNGEGNLGTKKVLGLYNGNNPSITSNMYEINPDWKSSEPTKGAFYKKITPTLVRFIYSNIRLYKNGIKSYNYSDFGDNSYLFSDTKTKSLQGYWLTDSITATSHNNIINNLPDYAFYMNEDGNIALSDKKDIRGVRLTAYIDISILDGNIFSDTKINSLEKKVIDGSSSTINIGEKITNVKEIQQLKNNTYYYPQGFTTIGNNKHMFYLAPLDRNDTNGNLAFTEDTHNGVLLYSDGSNFYQVLKGQYGHGNALAFDRTKNTLFIARSEKNDSGGRSYKYRTRIVDMTVNPIKLSSSDGELLNSDNNSVGGSTLAVSDDGKYLYNISGQTIYVRNNNWKILYNFDIPEYHGTLQNLTYMNGYLYVGVYESCGVKYQNYCYGEKHALNIYVYNAKFNPDGTPNRWFGHRVISYYADDITKISNVNYEIEGVGAYNNTLYIGFAKKTTDNITYVPAIYKYNPTFYTVKYILGNTNYTDKVFENRFVDMGLFLNNRNYTNGFIGWKASDGTVYKNSTGVSLRINENTELNGVYIDLPSDYSFDNNNIKINKRVTIDNLLKEINAYNSEIKVKRNNQIVTDTNQYVQYNDTLVVSNGNTELKSYNLMPTKVIIKYKDGTTEYDFESNINNSVELKSDINKTGYTLVGWKDLKDDKIYNISEKYPVTTFDVILETVWEANKYTIVYNANSGTGSMENSVFTYDVQGKLSKNTFTKTGYKFKGWSTSSTGVTVYQDEQSIKNLTTQGIINLYASWEAINEENIDEIINKKYLIKDKKVYNIPKKTGVNNLVLGLNSNYSYKIYDDANILTEGYVGTGNLLKVYMNNTLKKEYRVIIKGDITGEGEIEVNDVSKLYQFLKGKITINDYYIEAGNVETSIGDITVTDVAKLYQYIKGKINSL